MSYEQFLIEAALEYADQEELKSGERMLHFAQEAILDIKCGLLDHSAVRCYSLLHDYNQYEPDYSYDSY